MSNGVNPYGLMSHLQQHKRDSHLWNHRNKVELGNLFGTYSSLIYFFEVFFKSRNVTCIPQQILKNVSLPLGFIPGPEESSELYRLLYNELQNILEENDRLHELPILSDQGQGLIKFCKDNDLIKFFA